MGDGTAVGCYCATQGYPNEQDRRSGPRSMKWSAIVAYSLFYPTTSYRFRITLNHCTSSIIVETSFA
jgi:hypothetical protein